MPLYLVHLISKKRLKYYVISKIILSRACFLFLFLCSRVDHGAIPLEFLSEHHVENRKENYDCDAIIEVFNEDRLPLLGMILNQYRACRYIKSIYLRTTFSREYIQGFLNTVHSSTFELIVAHSESLNERFQIPVGSKSSCVITSDDDILVTVDDLLLLHQVWSYNPYSLVGPFSRKIAASASGATDIVYQDSATEYNIVLSKLLFVHKIYMQVYHSEKFSDLRAVVDKFHNCEDIAINIVASLLSGYPIHVAIHPQDLGDSRNDDFHHIRRNGLGLQPDHWAKRHECFEHMFRLYHHLPRLQSFSITRFTGEQSLCHHAGEKIPCRDIPLD